MTPTKRDLDRMNGVHPDLVLVVKEGFAIFPEAFADFPSFRVFVIEGVRTPEKQAEYVKAGVSWTMNSMHLIQPDGYAHAVDLGVQAGGAMRWEFSVYERLWRDCMRIASIRLDVPIAWGGDFKSASGKPLMDGPHFQLGS